jgi:hypothetical protein
MINRPKPILAAICVLAAGLRALGIDHGLPAVYVHAEAQVLDAALAVGRSLTPQHFGHPSLYPYLLFIWEGLFFVAGRIGGYFDSLLAFQQRLILDPSAHFLVGRSLSLVGSTLTVVAAYLLGRRLFDRSTGLIAAAALAVAPIAVRDAHYMKVDAIAALSLASALVALARLVADSEAAAHRRYWIIAGLLTGIAVSTDYLASFLGFTMAAVILVDVRRTGSWPATSRLALWAVGGALVGFLAGSPTLPFNLPRVVTDVRAGSDAAAAVLQGSLPGVFVHAKTLLSDAMGWPIGLAAVAGVIWMLASDWRRGIVLVSILGPLIVFAATTVSSSRHVNVVLPLMAVAAGFTLAQIVRRVENPTRLALLLTLPFIPGLVGSFAWDLFLRQPDTRTLAAEFIESNIPAGSSVLVQPYGPPLTQSREGLLESLRVNLGKEANAPIRFQLMLGVSPYPQPSFRLIYLGDGALAASADRVYIVPAEFSSGEGLAPLRRAGIEYVALTRGSATEPGLQELHAALAREGTRVAAFSPYRIGTSMAVQAAAPPFLHRAVGAVHRALERPGPTTEIWSVGEKPGKRRWGAPGS